MNANIAAEIRAGWEDLDTHAKRAYEEKAEVATLDYEKKLSEYTEHGFYTNVAASE